MKNFDYLPKAQPIVEQDYRYKGLYGGRGSGKSHLFAELVVIRTSEKKTNVVCVREIQKSLTQSAKKLIEDKQQDLMGDGYDQPKKSKIVGGGKYELTQDQRGCLFWSCKGKKTN